MTPTARRWGHKSPLWVVSRLLLLAWALTKLLGCTTADAVQVKIREGTGLAYASKERNFRCKRGHRWTSKHAVSFSFTDGTTLILCPACIREYSGAEEVAP